ncbi:uncharacterized protein LOC135336228 isoform X1 [Halichondria panicea]|uniref:uncharacterized protein LOC135336228 isoform X1 n=2 Tax=Halichondria panicea TaxID=6063 RepID=UPI00312B57D4
MKYQLLMICSLLGLGSPWNQPSTCYMRQTICSTNYKEAIEQLTDNIDGHSQQIQMLEAQLVNSNGQSEMKITELQVQLNTSIQILQADKDSFNESLQLVQAQLDNSNEQFGGQIMELQTQLNSSNQLLQRLQDQLSATTGVLQQSLSEQENRLENIQLIVEEVRLGTINNPASSCSDISQGRPSGEYWITTNTTSSPVLIYCDMNRTSCSCNTAGGWMRVANLDMTDPNQNCPEGFRLMNRTESPLRTCGRHAPGCLSTTYPAYGVKYSTVCGRINGYQSSTMDAFHPYFSNRALSIDDVYVDGVSLTHGQSPRQHIWTFANALDETRSTYYVCPCTRPDLTYTGVVPPFIGQDYFCETGSRQAFSYNTFYTDDPVWDGQGCGGTSTCCEFNNPPWFCKQLPQPTTDDIELRLCSDQSIGDEDTPIEIAEIYVS